MKYKGTPIPTAGHIIKRINHYAKPFSKNNNIPIWKIYVSYIIAFLMTGCGAMDYFLYDFYFLNNIGRQQFMTVKQRVSFDSNNNSMDGIDKLSNKEKALVLFYKYINRDWCGCEYHNHKSNYENFLKKHDKGIIKPQRGMGGSGIEIIDLKSFSPHDLYILCKKKKAVVEEIVIQHDAMEKMYPFAINTIRILTVKGNVIGAALRIGAGGGLIDNAHAGGIFTEVDIKSGVCICNAINHAGDSYITHPDTGTVIPGFQIPQWNKCITLVKEAATLIPEVSLVGWDIAVSETGPVIIEVNHMPGLELIQAPAKHGIRPLIK